MKTLFRISMGEGYYYGPYRRAIEKMVYNHNNEIVKIDIDVICGYLLAKRSQDIRTSLFIKSEGENNQGVKVSDDGGKTFYMTIEELEEGAELSTDEYIKDFGLCQQK